MANQDDWKDLLKQYEPVSLDRWLKENAPKVSSFEEPPPEIKRRQLEDLLQTMRMTKEEFITLALSQPDLWTDEELHYLEAAYAGGDSERIEQFAMEYFYGTRWPKTKEKEEPVQQIEEDKLETNLDPPDLPSGTASIPDLPALEGTLDVGKWWEKRPSRPKRRP
jgi:hypothetical protein